MNRLLLDEKLKRMPKRPLPKVVIFDKDGILYDTMQGHQDAWTAVYRRRFGVELKPDEIYVEEGRPNDETVERVSKNYGLDVPSKAEIEDMVREKIERYHSYDVEHLFPETIAMLDCVIDTGQVPMIATGGYYEGIKEKLLLELEGRIDRDHMVTGIDYDKGKPDPEPYLRAMEIAGVQAEDAVVIENAPLGVRSAVAAGALVFAINTGILEDAVLYDEGAAWVFDSHLELIEAWPMIIKTFQ